MARMRTAVPPASTFQVRGFTLTEMAVVLVIVALLIGGMILPMSAQQDLRYVTETQKTLNDAQEALLGFASATGRLPCPASSLSNGKESFGSGSPAGDVSNGICSNFYDGFLPAVDLGIRPVDEQGFAIDAWGRRIRYAVFAGTIGSGSYPTLTRIDGIRAATLNSVSSASLLSVCSTGTGINTTDCGSAPVITNKSPALVYSLGKNGGSGSAGIDEAANLNGDAVFVFHSPTQAGVANGEFDDMVVWLSANILFNRMIAAGRLP